MIRVCSQGHITGYRHCNYCAEDALGNRPRTQPVANRPEDRARLNRPQTASYREPGTDSATAYDIRGARSNQKETEKNRT